MAEKDIMVHHVKCGTTIKSKRTSKDWLFIFYSRMWLTIFNSAISVPCALLYADFNSGKSPFPVI